ncbi:MAG TPA: hypothetical protein VGB85_32780 [Nannocystis sp.]|jgi:hypothetical protein
MKLLLALPLALTLASCGGDTKTGDAKTGDAKTGDAKSSGGSTLELPKVGLKADAPAGTEVGDVIGGGVGHMVQGPGLVVNVETASETAPKTVDDAKKESEMFDGVKNLKDEKLPDGWLITFENVGGMGANYHVNTRREIDGKAITCNTMVSTPEQQNNAVNFCKSLKK